MRRNLRKLNFMIEEDVRRELEHLIPAGKRSIVVNDALRKELERIRRKSSIEKLLNSNLKGKRYSNSEIIDSLAMDRKEH
jgi:rRNA-processing protein FCF1